MDMEQNTSQEIRESFLPSKKDHSPYIEQIVTAGSLLKSVKHIERPVIHPVADFIIYTAFLAMDVKDWLFEFKEAQKKSLLFFRDQDTHWKTIALGLSTPKVKALVMERLPNLDKEKYFPNNTAEQSPQEITLRASPTEKKITTTTPGIKRGLKWKRDKRWEDLSPLDRKIFFEGCRRAQQPKRKNDFPWAELGVESLSKKLRAPVRQVKRSRFHLCELGLWGRIKRGYKDQGASKYSIFITPEMADAYFVKHRGKGNPQER